MPRKKKPKKQKPIEQFTHNDKDRLNNPPVGLVTPDTDKDEAKKKYQYDPHLDPQLQWAGKAEHASFEVPTVSLHVHERIDPKSIIESVRKEKPDEAQISLFETDKKPLRDAIEFYKHKENWTNRLIAGDSLLVMNSLLEKEGMGEKVQMIYFDPPYGIKYGSNFQPFVNKRDVKDGKDEDLTAEPEMIKAFRDTWQLGIHSYLTYIRDRLLLCRELLTDSGSIFIQINDDNLHLIKNIGDEVFGKENCVNIIPFKKRASYLQRFGKGLFELFDYIIWFSKDIKNLHVNSLFSPVNIEECLRGEYRYIDEGDSHRTVTNKDINNPNLELSKVFRTQVGSKKTNDPQNVFPLVNEGSKVYPPSGQEWKFDKEGYERLVKLDRLMFNSSWRPYKEYITDFPYSPINNLWDDTAAEMDPIYAVQTDELPIERCMLLSTMPGELVLDLTCGSGTTAYVAEQWGRRWITCDTSRVSITLTKQRLMTSSFDYYELAHPNEGIGSGLKYNSYGKVKLEILAENREPEMIDLFDKPKVNNKKQRITGPFTIEAVPSPVTKSPEEIEFEEAASDESVSRSGETLRQAEWRDELFRTGVRAKGGRTIEFTRIEPLAGTRFLQAEGETKEEQPKRVLIAFGPEHAPLEQRQVELAIEEAGNLKPKPDMILFAAFHFDEEAAKDIDETNWPGVTLLRAQMNADLLTDDLKKKRSSNESFWLIGQPDVDYEEITKGEDKGKIRVEVKGFDYYNPKTGNVESGGKSNIAMWMLDPDYDGRSLFPRQVFFPMAGAKDGWAKLAKNLKAEIDEEKIEAFRGTKSLPFTPGKQIAVKIVDDRGIESLKIIRL